MPGTPFLWFNSSILLPQPVFLLVFFLVCGKDGGAEAERKSAEAKRESKEQMTECDVCEWPLEACGRGHDCCLDCDSHCKPFIASTVTTTTRFSWNLTPRHTRLAHIYTRGRDWTSLHGHAPHATRMARSCASRPCSHRKKESNKMGFFSRLN